MTNNVSEKIKEIQDVIVGKFHKANGRGSLGNVIPN